MLADPVITLLTDFGTSDVYVGVMKGVILGIRPRCTIVDLSHEVPPQAVHVAALLLAESQAFFPSGTVHVGVVDPGVGSARRAIAVETGNARGVGPDNGILTALIERATRVVEIRETRYMLPRVSTTFHGRDVFAPVGAHLLNGVGLSELGPDIQDAVQVTIPTARPEGDRIIGEVIHIDRFGNVITSIEESNIRDWPGVEVEVHGARIPGLSKGYTAGSDDHRRGALRALIGSSGRLEIAVPGGSAAASTGSRRGDRVVVRNRANG
jgi:S-adenosylmethionine hydrolase